MSERLVAMRSRTMYPREDVVSLRIRVEVAERELEDLRMRHDSVSEELSRVEREGRLEAQGLDHKLDELVIELERSMSKLTRDRELLQGVKALVRIVKDS